MSRTDPSGKKCPMMCRVLDKAKTIDTTHDYKPHIDTSKTPIVWVLGGPGCGKGTQCEKIVGKYGFTHLSTGDLLREEVQRGGEMASAIAEVMNRGELVATEHVLHLVKQEMQSKADTAKGFLVDGYPREKSQGAAFEQSIAPVTSILYFEVSRETLKQRLLHRAATSARFDDNEETIQLRMKTFFENNQFVLEQYPNKINVINAESTIDVIFLAVEKVLDPLVAALQATNPK